MKKLFLSAAFWAMLTHGAAAQAVTVEGLGADRNDALRSAQRSAIEQAAGTFIDSRTIVQNAQIALDEIYTNRSYRTSFERIA